MPKELAIAVIDDDPSFRIALAESLRSLNYTVQAFSSAEEFLDASARPTFDCLITDIHMPGLSGFDLVRRLAARGSTTPIIMITAHTESHLEINSLDSGAVCLLRKPFETSTLLAYLEEI